METLRQFLIRAPGNEVWLDQDVVVTLKDKLVDPAGDFELVGLDDLRNALQGENQMQLTDVRNYRHQFQRSYGVGAMASEALRTNYADEFLMYTNKRLARRGPPRKTRG